MCGLHWEWRIMSENKKWILMKMCAGSFMCTVNMKIKIIHRQFSLNCLCVKRIFCPHICAWISSFSITINSNVIIFITYHLISQSIFFLHIWYASLVCFTNPISLSLFPLQCCVVRIQGNRSPRGTGYLKWTRIAIIIEWCSHANISRSWWHYVQCRWQLARYTVFDCMLVFRYSSLHDPSFTV